MDTYIRVDWEKCQRCGLCVEVCPCLEGGRNKRPSNYCDNPPCRGCEQTCKEVCYYDAIYWERF